MAFLRRNLEWVKSFHYKDFEETENGLSETDIGTGIVDTRTCFDIVKDLGVIQLADQDKSKIDFLDDLARIVEMFRRFEEETK